MQAERAAVRAWAATIDARRVVFLDESGANLATGRSHAWLRLGTELIEPRPMNWGTNLTMVGAMRMDGWLTLATGWQAMNAPGSSPGCSADWCRVSAGAMWSCWTMQAINTSDLWG